MAEQEKGEIDTMMLDRLEAGQTAKIREITRDLEGVQRRRLLDMGLTPGTTIRLQFNGPMGNPAAYLVRGTTIALRQSQTRHIKISVENSEDQRHG